MLYERLGAPCTQCGRRFQGDEEGRKKKTTHMDWHFRVHQRMAEAEKRGQHRSWYVDELVSILYWYYWYALIRNTGLDQIPRERR
jgi:hypothetical protein